MGFLMTKFRQQKRLADPLSNRSQKKRLNRFIKINDPEALLAAGGEYQLRQHKRDKRKRDYLRTVDAEKILGMGKEKTLQQYTYKLPLEQVIQEAEILCTMIGIEGETWLNYVVAAHHNVSATGFVKKRSSAHSVEHGLNWITINYPDYSEKTEQKNDSNFVKLIKKGV
jgi:hypothetical protein